MAEAWRSVKCSFLASASKPGVRKWILEISPFIRQALASFKLLDPRRIAMIRSITSQAAIRPSCTSFLSSSFWRRTWYFFLVFTCWKSRKCFKIPRRVRVSGLPPAMASMLTPKVSSSFVFLYRRLMILSTSASLRSSRTIRIPSLFDWLEISTTSGSFLLSTSSATSIRNLLIPAPIMV